jgi:hypothetical protein
VQMRLLGEVELVAHQVTLVEALDSGSFIPLRIESLMPGMESRYRVSSMDRQSSSPTRTADLLLPVMWIGSWVSERLSTSL